MYILQKICHLYIIWIMANVGQCHIWFDDEVEPSEYLFVWLLQQIRRLLDLYCFFWGLDWIIHGLTSYREIHFQIYFMFSFGTKNIWK